MFYISTDYSPDRNGLNRRGQDAEGYFDDGFDMDGFDRYGMSMSNLPREWYDEDIYDPFGMDVYGYTRAGLDSDLRDIDGYDLDGFDAQGYDYLGYDHDGYNVQGRDRSSRNKEGYSTTGFNQHHRSRAGDIEPGYSTAPNGNARRDVHEGPSTEVMECEHRAGFSRGCATCCVCNWTSDIFHQYCHLCRAHLCRMCNGAGPERQRASIRRQYPWPGSDPYGIDSMFERMEDSLFFARMAALKPRVARRKSISGLCGFREIERVEVWTEESKSV